MADRTPRKIAPPKGKLGVLCVGLGAVASTFIAGVENARRGRAKPFGSLTQMATIRLGKRTDKRTPLIKDFVPLAALDQLVFGAWDPIPDDGYESCLKCGVLDRHEHVEPIADFLKGIKPMPAVFDQQYVKRLHGTNVKTGKTKKDLAEQLRKDIRDFKTRQRAATGWWWCGAPRPRSSSARARSTSRSRHSRRRMEANDAAIAPSMLYA